MYPVVRGIRATFEYGWADATRDASIDGAAEVAAEVSYREYRLTFGVADVRGRFYIDATMLDFAKRTLKVDTATNGWVANPFQWRLGCEGGLVLSSVLRAGAFLDYDMVAGIDWMFGDSAQGYNVGVASAVVAPPVHLEARLQREQLGSQDGTATGTGLIVSASVTY